jgi:glycosyltransferase involved in cell wall biosynthesis
VSARVLVASRHDPFTDRPQPLQVLGTAIGLAQAGAAVTLVMDSRRRGARREDVEARLGRPLGRGLELRLVRGGHPGLRGMRRRAVLARLLRQDWDLLLTRDFKLTPLLARHRGDAIVAHEWHAMPSALGQGDEGEARAARLADLDVYVSHGLARFVEQRLTPRGAAGVVPNGCWIDEASAQHNLQCLATANRVVCAGLFRQPADLAALQTAVSAMADGLQVEVIGRKLDAQVGMRSRGPVAPARIPDLLSGALCQLALYRQDLNTEVFASPLKVVAALASGVPLVATDLPTVRELVEPGRTGLLVPPGDGAAVAAAVADLDRDRGLARELASRAIEAARGLTWQQRGSTLLQALERS